MARPTTIAVSRIGAAMVSAWKIMVFNSSMANSGFIKFWCVMRDLQVAGVLFFHVSRITHHSSFHIPKLRTSDCTISDQPSTSTNSNNFSGSEIVIGGIIIMPMLISTVATTMSIRMNGT